MYAVVHISSTAVQTVIGRILTKSDKVIDVVAVGIAHTDSFFGGQVRNREQLLAAIHQSLHEAMNMAGLQVFWVGLSFACPEMIGSNEVQPSEIFNNRRPSSTGHVIEHRDVQAIFEQIKQKFATESRSVLQVCTQFLRLDNHGQVESVVGMRANHLAMCCHVMSVPKTYHTQMVELFATYKIEIHPWIFDGVAGAQYALTDDEKQRGVLFVDIGAGTTNICLFNEHKLLFSHCLAVGGRDIDQRIAERFGLSLSDAETLKKNHGSVYPNSKPRGGFTTVARSDGGEVTVNLRELAEIIEGEYLVLFERIIKMINDKKLGDYMRSGIVVAGGAAKMSGLVVWLEENPLVNVRQMRASYQVGICTENLSNDNIRLLRDYIQAGDLHSVFGALMYQHSKQYIQDESMQNYQEQNRSMLAKIGRRYQGWLNSLKEKM